MVNNLLKPNHECLKRLSKVHEGFKKGFLIRSSAQLLMLSRVSFHASFKEFL